MPPHTRIHAFAGEIPAELEKHVLLANAEGRGFESLQPLKRPAFAGLFCLQSVGAFESPGTNWAPAARPLLNVGGAKVRQHGQHAAVAVLALGQVELHQQMAHMGLDGAFAQI